MSQIKPHDIAVIGAGASGMTAAIEAAVSGADVIILEHMDKAGKKILATGNGKCNYTNQYFTEGCYRGSDPCFAKTVLQNYDTCRIVDFFSSLGIYPKNKNGYFYPYSETASSINEVLKYELDRLHVSVFTGRHVTKILHNKHFKIFCDLSDEIYYADKIIISTGGKSGQSLGSDGSGLELAKSFGHKIVPLVPALVQLKSSGKYLKTTAGVRIDGRVDLYINNVKTVSESGELLFTSYGISGIPVLQLSRYASYALMKKNSVAVKLDFFENMSKNSLHDLLVDRFHNRHDKTNEEVFTGLLNRKLTYVILKESGIDPEACTDNRKIPYDKLIDNMKSFTMIITGSNGFEASQVTAGGVATDEINPYTMQSKLVDKLFFSGEIIDIDGTCGGYNLHWAWATGMLAGKNAAEKVF